MPTVENIAPEHFLFWFFVHVSVQRFSRSHRKLCQHYQTPTKDSFIHSFIHSFIPICLTPSLPWCHLKTTSKCAKLKTFKPFVSLFALHVKGLWSQRIQLKAGVTGPEQTVWRRVIASFYPEILPAGALKGLMSSDAKQHIKNTLYNNPVVSWIQPAKDLTRRLISHWVRTAKPDAADHGTTLLKELHWVPVKSRCQYKIATLAYRHFEGSLPPYISSSLCTYELTETKGQTFRGIPSFHWFDQWPHGSDLFRPYCRREMRGNSWYLLDR